MPGTERMGAKPAPHGRNPVGCLHCLLAVGADALRESPGKSKAAGRSQAIGIGAHARAAPKAPAAAHAGA